MMTRSLNDCATTARKETAPVGRKKEVSASVQTYTAMHTAHRIAEGSIFSELM